jgi:hypothetical protein
LDLEKSWQWYCLLLLTQRLVEQEDLQFHEEYMNEQDPSILHFLLASGDDVWCHMQINYFVHVSFLILRQLHPSVIGIQQATPWWFDDHAHSWSWDFCSSLDMDVLSFI